MLQIRKHLALCAKTMGFRKTNPNITNRHGVGGGNDRTIRAVACSRALISVYWNITNVNSISYKHTNGQSAQSWHHPERSRERLSDASQILFRDTLIDQVPIWKSIPPRVVLKAPKHIFLISLMTWTRSLHRKLKQLWIIHFRDWCIYLLFVHS